MALVKCKECGEDVYEKTASCQKCGAPTEHTDSQNGLVMVLAFVVGLLFLGNPSKMDHLEKTGLVSTEEYYQYNNYLIFSTLTVKSDGVLWSRGVLWYVNAIISIRPEDL